MPGARGLKKADPAALVPLDKSRQSRTEILGAIRSGEFAPGQHLFEADLTARFGMSRSSLREALRQLSVEGMVELSRFRGARVATLDFGAALDLLDVMDPLAQLAARRAAEACDTDEARARITDAARAAQESAGGPDRAYYLECRRAFYGAMIALGGNAELARHMPISRADLFRTQVEALQRNAQHRHYAAGYSRISDAIVARDPEAARATIAAHFQDMREIVQHLRLAAETAPEEGPGASPQEAP